jgi:plasmid stabilization system protein ParE
MNFRVVIQPDAEAEVEEAFNYIAARSRDYAVPWLRGLYKAVATLEKFPPRCGVAPEGKYFKEEIRQYLYGRSRHRYRILFTIHRDEVQVLHVRHAARWKPE